MIDRIELYSTHASQATGDYYDFRILLCATEMTSLTNSFETNYGGAEPDTVLQTDTLEILWNSSSPGWNGFDLHDPFAFDGSSSLIVEFQYLGSTGTTVNARAASLPAADRCLDAGHPSSAGGDHMSFLTCLRLRYTPTGSVEGSEECHRLSMEPEVNPVPHLFVINVGSPVEAHATVGIYACDGRFLGSAWDGMLVEGENSIRVDASGLLPGLCFLVLDTGECRASTRVLLLP